MAIFNFNPISFVKGLFSGSKDTQPQAQNFTPANFTPVSGATQKVSPAPSSSTGKFSIQPPKIDNGGLLVSSSNVTGASKVAQSSAPEQPTEGGGFTGFVTNVAKKAGDLAKNIGQFGTANIGSIFSGGYNAGQGEPKPESADFVGRGDIRPTGAIPSGPYQNFTPAPPKAPDLNYTPANFTPARGGGQFEQAVGPDGRIIFRPAENRQFKLVDVGGGQMSRVDVSPQAPSGATGFFSPIYFGGISQSSFNPFTSGGTQGNPGGASLLPGSFGPGPFRTAGTTPLVLTDDEERKRKQNIINKADFSLSGAFRDFLGIPTARAETTPTPSGNQQQQQPTQGGGLNLSFGPTGPANISGGVPTTPKILSNQQQTLIGSTAEGAPRYSDQFVGPGPISGQEFSRATTQKTSQPAVKPGDTVTSMRTNIQNRSSEALSTINNVNQNLKSEVEQQAALKALTDSVNKSGGYVKVADSTSGQINVAKINSDGSIQYIGPQEFQQAGLNIDHIPDVGQFNQEYAKNLNANLAQSIDTVTGRPYTKEDLDLSKDNPLKGEMDKIKGDIDELKKKFNFDIDIEAERTKVVQEEGLATLRSQKKTLQENINGILGVYEKLADEIRNDPDFSQRLKSRRLQFLSDEQKRALTGFQRQLEILNDDIKIAEDKVTQRMKDKLDTYTLQFNQLKNLESQEEKIRNAMAKATDDARALITFYVNTYSGTVWDELPADTRRQIEAEFKRLGAPHLVGTLKAGMTTQKTRQLLLNAQSVANRTPTNVTVNIPGFDPIKGRYTPQAPANQSSQSLENDQMARLRQAGIPDNIFNSITQDILQGDSLDSIRANLRALGAQGKITGAFASDPAKILDVYDGIVNIASLVSGRRFTTPGADNFQLDFNLLKQAGL